MSYAAPAIRARAELELRRRRAAALADPAPTVEPIAIPRPAIECYWQTWLEALFRRYVKAGFSERHVEFWTWLWAMQRNVRPHPFLAIWPRAGGKSTSVELGTVAIGCRGVRSYAWYICETQDQADDHVQNIAALLEGAQLEEHYPLMTQRAVGKFGSSKGWRRNRLRTAAGFTIDALGLDTAARGMKLEDKRPDLMIIDDVDGEFDSPPVTKKKIGVLTKKLLPAGAPSLAVIAMQNLVHPDSVFAQLMDGRADFLRDRILSGPFPAVEHLEYAQNDQGIFVITGGTPTWGGQDLQRCQEMILDIGMSAFLEEAQHKVDAPAGGMFDHLEYRHCTMDEVPDLDRIVVWCDPAVTNTDESDAHGIQADGLASDGTIYRLWSWEDRATPLEAIQRAILKALELKAEAVGIETDQGGDTWESVYAQAWQKLTDMDDPNPTILMQQYRNMVAAGIIDEDAECPEFRSAKAGQGHGPKAHRGGLMLVDYERGKFVHVYGTHTVLERALRRFPKTKPLDLVDCCFWSWSDLRDEGVEFRPAAGGERPMVQQYRVR